MKQEIVYSIMALGVAPVVAPVAVNAAELPEYVQVKSYGYLSGQDEYTISEILPKGHYKLSSGIVNVQSIGGLMQTIFYQGSEQVTIAGLPVTITGSPNSYEFGKNAKINIEFDVDQEREIVFRFKAKYSQYGSPWAHLISGLKLERHPIAIDAYNLLLNNYYTPTVNHFNSKRDELIGEGKGSLLKQDETYGDIYSKLRATASNDFSALWNEKLDKAKISIDKSYSDGGIINYYPIMSSGLDGIKLEITNLYNGYADSKSKIDAAYSTLKEMVKKMNDALPTESSVLNSGPVKEAKKEAEKAIDDLKTHIENNSSKETTGNLTDLSTHKTKITAAIDLIGTAIKMVSDYDTMTAAIAAKRTALDAAKKAVDDKAVADMKANPVSEYTVEHLWSVTTNSIADKIAAVEANVTYKNIYQGYSLESASYTEAMSAIDAGISNFKDNANKAIDLFSKVYNDVITVKGLLESITSAAEDKDIWTQKVEGNDRTPYSTVVSSIQTKYDDVRTKLGESLKATTSADITSESNHLGYLQKNVSADALTASITTLQALQANVDIDQKSYENQKDAYDNLVKAANDAARYIQGKENSLTGSEGSLTAQDATYGDIYSDLRATVGDDLQEAKNALQTAWNDIQTAKDNATISTKKADLTSAIDNAKKKADDAVAPYATAKSLIDEAYNSLRTVQKVKNDLLTADVVGLGNTAVTTAAEATQKAIDNMKDYIGQNDTKTTAQNLKGLSDESNQYIVTIAEKLGVLSDAINTAKATQGDYEAMKAAIQGKTNDLDAAKTSVAAYANETHALPVATYNTVTLWAKTISDIETWIKEIDRKADIHKYDASTYKTNTEYTTAMTGIGSAIEAFRENAQKAADRYAKVSGDAASADDLIGKLKSKGEGEGQAYWTNQVEGIELTPYKGTVEELTKQKEAVENKLTASLSATGSTDISSEQNHWGYLQKNVGETILDNLIDTLEKMLDNIGAAEEASAAQESAYNALKTSASEASTYIQNKENSLTGNGGSLTAQDATYGDIYNDLRTTVSSDMQVVKEALTKASTDIEAAWTSKTIGKDKTKLTSAIASAKAKADDTAVAYTTLKTKLDQAYATLRQKQKGRDDLLTAEVAALGAPSVTTAAKDAQDAIDALKTYIGQNDGKAGIANLDDLSTLTKVIDSAVTRLSVEVGLAKAAQSAYGTMTAAVKGKSDALATAKTSVATYASTTQGLTAATYNTATLWKAITDNIEGRIKTVGENVEAKKYDASNYQLTAEYTGAMSGIDTAIKDYEDNAKKAAERYAKVSGDATKLSGLISSVTTAAQPKAIWTNKVEGNELTPYKTIVDNASKELENARTKLTASLSATTSTDATSASNHWGYLSQNVDAGLLTTAITTLETLQKNLDTYQADYERQVNAYNTLTQAATAAETYIKTLEDGLTGTEGSLTKKDDTYGDILKDLRSTVGSDMKEAKDALSTAQQNIEDAKKKETLVSSQTSLASAIEAAKSKAEATAVSYSTPRDLIVEAYKTLKEKQADRDKILTAEIIALQNVGVITAAAEAQTAIDALRTYIGDNDTKATAKNLVSLKTYTSKIETTIASLSTAATTAKALKEAYDAMKAAVKGKTADLTAAKQDVAAYANETQKLPAATYNTENIWTATIADIENKIKAADKGVEDNKATAYKTGTAYTSALTAIDNAITSFKANAYAAAVFYAKVSGAAAETGSLISSVTTAAGQKAIWTNKVEGNELTPYKNIVEGITATKTDVEKKLAASLQATGSTDATSSQNHYGYLNNNLTTGVLDAAISTLKTLQANVETYQAAYDQQMAAYNTLTQAAADAEAYIQGLEDGLTGTDGSLRKEDSMYGDTYKDLRSTVNGDLQEARTDLATAKAGIETAKTQEQLGTSKAALTTAIEAAKTKADNAAASYTMPKSLIDKAYISLKKVQIIKDSLLSAEVLALGNAAVTSAGTAAQEAINALRSHIEANDTKATAQNLADISVQNDRISLAMGQLNTTIIAARKTQADYEDMKAAVSGKTATLSEAKTYVARYARSFSLPETYKTEILWRETTNSIEKMISTIDGKVDGRKYEATTYQTDAEYTGGLKAIDDAIEGFRTSAKKAIDRYAKVNGDAGVLTSFVESLTEAASGMDIWTKKVEGNELTPYSSTVAGLTATKDEVQKKLTRSLLATTSADTTSVSNHWGYLRQNVEAGVLSEALSTLRVMLKSAGADEAAYADQQAAYNDLLAAVRAAQTYVEDRQAQLTGSDGSLTRQNATYGDIYKDLRATVEGDMEEPRTALETTQANIDRAWANVTIGENKVALTSAIEAAKEKADGIAADYDNLRQQLDKAYATLKGEQEKKDKVLTTAIVSLNNPSVIANEEETQKEINALKTYIEQNNGKKTVKNLADLSAYIQRTTTAINRLTVAAGLAEASQNSYEGMKATLSEKTEALKAARLAVGTHATGLGLPAGTYDPAKLWAATHTAIEGCISSLDRSVDDNKYEATDYALTDEYNTALKGIETAIRNYEANAKAAADRYAKVSGDASSVGTLIGRVTTAAQDKDIWTNTVEGNPLTPYSTIIESLTALKQEAEERLQASLAATGGTDVTKDDNHLGYLANHVPSDYLDTALSTLQTMLNNVATNQDAYNDQVVRGIKADILALAESYYNRINTLTSNVANGLYGPCGTKVTEALKPISAAILKAVSADGTVAEMQQVYRDVTALDLDGDGTNDLLALETKAASEYVPQAEAYNAIYAAINEIDIPAATALTEAADPACAYYTGRLNGYYTRQVEELKDKVDGDTDWVASRAAWVTQAQQLKAEIEGMPALAAANLKAYEEQKTQYNNAVTAYYAAKTTVSAKASARKEEHLAALDVYKEMFDNEKATADREYQEGKSATNGIAGIISTLWSTMNGDVKKWTDESDYDEGITQANKARYEAVLAAEKEAEAVYDGVENTFKAYDELKSSEARKAAETAREALKEKYGSTSLDSYKTRISEIHSEANTKYINTVSPDEFDKDGGYVKQLVTVADELNAYRDYFVEAFNGAVNPLVAGSISTYKAAIDASKERAKKYSPTASELPASTVASNYIAVDGMLSDIEDAYQANPRNVTTLDGALNAAGNAETGIAAGITKVEQGLAQSVLKMLTGQLALLEAYLTAEQKRQLETIKTKQADGATAVKEFAELKQQLVDLIAAANATKSGNADIANAQVALAEVQAALYKAYETVGDYAGGADVRTNTLDKIQEKVNGYGEVTLTNAGEIMSESVTWKTDIARAVTTELCAAEVEALRKLLTQANTELKTYKNKAANAASADEISTRLTKAESDFDAAETKAKTDTEGALEAMKAIEDTLVKDLNTMKVDNEGVDNDAVAEELLARITSQEKGISDDLKPYPEEVLQDAMLKSYLDLAAQAIQYARDYVNNNKANIYASKEAAEKKIADIETLRGMIKARAEQVAKESYAGDLYTWMKLIDSQVTNTVTLIRSLRSELDAYGKTGNYRSKLTQYEAYAGQVQEAWSVLKNYVDNLSTYAEKDAVFSTFISENLTTLGNVNKDCNDILASARKAYVGKITDALTAKLNAVTYNENQFTRAERSTLNKMKADITAAISSLETKATSQMTAKDVKSAIFYGTPSRSDIELMITELQDYAQALTKKNEVKGHITGKATIDSDDLLELVDIILNNREAEVEAEGKLDRCDIDGDGEITITDLVYLRYYLVHDNTWPTPADLSARGRCEAEADMEASSVNTADGITRVAVNLENLIDYQALQVDIHLPKGAVLSGKALGERVEGAHLLAADKTTGTVRMIILPTGEHIISGTDGAVIYLDVEHLSGNVTVDNVILTDTRFHTHRIGSDPTAIDRLRNAAKAAGQTIYNLGGKVMEGLKKGVNIIRNADGSTKKVVRK